MSPLGKSAAALGAAAATALVFLPALGFGYVYDDHRFYESNVHLASPSILWRAFADPSCQTADMTHAGLWRPMRTLSFALDHAIGGDGPFVPHLTNLLLAAAGAALLALLLQAWRFPAWAAFLGAVAYAVHPAQRECVAWISSRGDLLAAALVWGALLADLRGRRVLPVVLGALALLSKEQAVVWPVLAVLSRLLAGRSLGEAARAALLPAAACGAFVLARYGLLTEAGQQGGLGQGRLGPGTLLAMLGHQAWFTALPVGAVFDWQMPWQGRPPLLPVLAGLACAGALCVRATRVPAAWFLAALVPTLFIQAVLPLNILVTDRFLLFALPALGVAVAGAVRWSLRRGDGAVVAGASVACLCLAAITWSELPRWRDDVTLWTPTVEKVPGHVRARSWLGSTARREGRLADALVHFSVIARDPGMPGKQLYQLAWVQEKLAIQGQDPELMEAALASIQESLRRFSMERQEGVHELLVIARVMEADLLLILTRRDQGLAAVDRLVASPRIPAVPAVEFEVDARAARLAHTLEVAGDANRANRVRQWAARSRERP